MIDVLDDLIVPAYYKASDLFFTGLAKELWMIGGRNSIKSTVAGYFTPLGVMMHPGVNAMVLRQHDVDLKTSVYPNIKQCIEWLDEKMPEQHLSYRWEFRKDCREMVFDGNRSIVFHGLDDPTKRKSEKPPLGGYFGFLWHEELNEFDMLSVKSLRKSILRGGPIGQSIYTFNPPQSKAEWVNAEAARPKRGRYVFKTTFLDVLPYHREWLGETFIEDALAAKAENSLEWRHELMGEVTGTGGEIFCNVEAQEISDEQIAYFKSHGMDRYGLDIGFSNDPTALTEFAYDESTRTIYIWLADGQPGMFEEDIYEMLDKHHLIDKTIVADYGGGGDRVIKKLQRMGVRRIRECWKSPDGWRETGINFMRSSRRRIVIDPRPHRAKKAWDEFSTYEYLKYKNGDYHTDFPKGKDHWIDSTRYGLEPDIKKDYKPKVWSLPKGYAPTLSLG